MVVVAVNSVRPGLGGRDLGGSVASAMLPVVVMRTRPAPHGVGGRGEEEEQDPQANGQGVTKGRALHRFPGL